MGAVVPTVCANLLPSSYCCSSSFSSMRISILTTPGCLVARNKSVTGVLIDVGAEAREDLEMREKQETTQKKAPTTDTKSSCEAPTTAMKSSRDGHSLVLNKNTLMEHESEVLAQIMVLCWRRKKHLVVGPKLPGTE